MPALRVNWVHLSMSLATMASSFAGKRTVRLPPFVKVEEFRPSTFSKSGAGRVTNYCDCGLVGCADARAADQARPFLDVARNQLFRLLRREPRHPVAPLLQP